MAPIHAPRTCRLVALRAEGEALLLLLEVDGDDVPVSVPIDAATGHALRHVHALHAHPAGCGRRRDVHVDLLLRSLRAVGAAPDAVVVRPGPEPAFWLRVAGADGVTEVDLGVLDAVVLLLAGRLPVRVTSFVDPWQDAIERLLPDR